MAAVPRTIRLASGCLLALLAVASLAGCYGAPSADAASHRQLRGLQLHSLWSGNSIDNVRHELNLARAAGSTAVRLDIGWGSIEESRKGERSGWYVEKLDSFISEASRRGLKVVATVWSTPCWASTAPGDLKQGCRGRYWERDVQKYAPANPGDYGDIVRWVTSRYGTRLAALEVWNEPNLLDGRFWRAPNRARAYAALLRAAYRGARSGDRRIPVLAASLSRSDTSFLGELYAHGIKGHYDALAIHPYGDNGYRELRNLRAFQISKGDRKPIWVTEFGFPTGRDPDWNFSEGEQAQRISRGFSELATLPWVRGAFLYNLRDKGTNAHELEDNMGVVRRDYSRKPSFGAMASTLRRLPR